MTKAKTYTAPHAVYTGGRMYDPGEPFTTDAPKGKEWDTISPVEKAAAEASDPKNQQDIDYTKMSKSALEAVAAEKGVNPSGLSKDDLIDAIKAANEPAL